MDLPKEVDDYIKDTIDLSLGLPIPAKTLELKLRNSEEERRRLEDVVFLLEERIRDSQRQIDMYKEEASMNARGLRRCIEEKEGLMAEYESVRARCKKLEEECALFHRDFDTALESIDELAQENAELRAQLMDDSVIAELSAEVDSLKKDKEKIRINLVKAEEEVKALFEENELLEAKNKKLMKLLSKQKHHLSESATSSTKSTAKGKRKSSLERLESSSPSHCPIDFNSPRSPKRSPFSALQQNSPERPPLLALQQNSADT